MATTYRPNGCIHQTFAKPCKHHWHKLYWIHANSTTNFVQWRIGSQRHIGGGWILAIENLDILATGSNKDTGHPRYQNSYRSEAQAHLAGVSFIYETCKFFCIQQPKTKTICDNEGLIKKIISENISSSDIASDILQDILDKDPELMSYHHVKVIKTKKTQFLTTTHT